MSSISRVPRFRRRLTVVLASAAVALASTLPSGVAVGAATAGPACPTLGGDGGTCSLVIVAPSMVAAGSGFTVTVNVTTDGSTLATGDPCAARLPVTIRVSNGETYDRTVTKTASGAVASVAWPGLTDGSYFIQASYEGPVDACSNAYYSGGWEFTVFAISPTDSLAPCPAGTTCEQTLSGGGSAATIAATDGTFRTMWDDTTGAEVPPVGGCGGPVDATAGVLVFTATTTGSKSIVFALAPSLVKRGTSTYNLCWTAPYPFIAKSKRYATSYLDSTSTRWWTGLLRDCKAGDPGPCLAFRKSNKRNAVFLGVIAPPDLDPKGYVN